ncbi:MAG: glycosyl hydrolase family 2 [Opitutales bacterium]|nr:glycosyl hydrolase family 2 [Opitutales bacterium]
MNGLLCDLWVRSGRECFPAVLVAFYAAALAPLLLLAACAPARESEPFSVHVERAPGGQFTLLRNGEPFIMKGAGGRSRIEELVAAGGNTVRTWGVDDLEREIAGMPFLDYMHAQGLAVLAGIWVQHERHGFDYSDPDDLERQRRTVREAVETYRDHPAIVVWGLGNEMEAFRGDADDTPVWQEVNILARIVKEVDPSRPVMTTVAGVTPEKVASVLRHAPEVDILGVNAYAAAIRTGEILNEAGWDRPFVLAEFGPRGHWEVPLTPWGSPVEPTSEEKARYYLNTYETVMEDAGDRCLGTFAFLWGHKQEVTHTWYGMFLSGGEKLPAVDVMTYAWSGRYPEVRCPVLRTVDFDGNGRVVPPGTRWDVSAEAVDPQGLPLEFAWEVVSEQSDPAVGGDREEPPPRHPDAILAADENSAAVRAPDTPGAYRLFITVRNTENSATVANFPFKVEAP